MIKLKTQERKLIIKGKGVTLLVDSQFPHIDGNPDFNELYDRLNAELIEAARRFADTADVNEGLLTLVASYSEERRASRVVVKRHYVLSRRKEVLRTAEFSDLFDSTDMKLLK